MIATESTLKIPEQNSASVLGTGAGGDCQPAGAGKCELAAWSIDWAQRCLKPQIYRLPAAGYIYVMPIVISTSRHRHSCLDERCRGCQSSGGPLDYGTRKTIIPCSLLYIITCLLVFPREEWSSASSAIGYRQQEKMPCGEQCLLLPTKDSYWPLIKGAAAAEVVILSVGLWTKGLKKNHQTL
jgi:hypothetical protein